MLFYGTKKEEKKRIDYREYLIRNEESQKVDFVRGLEGVYEKCLEIAQEQGVQPNKVRVRVFRAAGGVRSIEHVSYELDIKDIHEALEGYEI